MIQTVWLDTTEEDKRKGFHEYCVVTGSIDLDDYSEEELNTILGEVRTNQDGVPKPQLAKQADKVSNKKVFDKEYLGSRKIDGLRCIIYMGEDGELHTASRGAMNYDAGMYQILSHPDLIKLFIYLKSMCRV
mgnify:CR=1 FL=1